MHIKRYLNPCFIRLFYHAKNIGWLFLIPIFIFIVLIPILNYMQYVTGGINQELYLNIIRYSQWLMPFFSVWNVIFSLHESVESEGYELFYMKNHHLKLIDTLVIYGVSFIFITFLFVFYGFLFPNMWLEYIRIVSISFLFLGIAYGGTYLFKSITPTLIILILYVFASIVFVSHYPVFLLFYTLEIMSWQLFFEHYSILLLLGCVCFLVGFFASKKYY